VTTTWLQAPFAAGSSVIRRRWVAPPLPREHGVWAWLLLPLVAGGAAAGSVNPLLLLTIGALAAYVVRAPLEMALRHPAQRRAHLAWASLYATVALLALAPLLLYYDRWGLMPLGAMGAAIALPVLLSRRLRYRWRAQGELLVVAGLSLLGPIAYYAATGDFDARAAASGYPALYGSGQHLLCEDALRTSRPGTAPGAPSSPPGRRLGHHRAGCAVRLSPADRRRLPAGHPEDVRPWRAAPSTTCGGRARRCCTPASPPYIMAFAPNSLLFPLDSLLYTKTWLVRR
jgi:hypothetical protein